jgi:hypothetical protein
MLNSDTSIPLSRALRAVHARAARLAARAEDYRRVAIAAETEAHRIIVNAERAEAQRRVSGRSRKGVALSQRSTESPFGRTGVLSGALCKPQNPQSSGLPKNDASTRAQRSVVSGPRLIWVRP